jgi:hypothetical protein
MPAVYKECKKALYLLRIFNYNFFMKTIRSVVLYAVFCIALFFAGGINQSNAQGVKGTNFKFGKHFFTGGDFSVTFTNGINVDIAPLIGYKIYNFSVGFSPFIKYGATAGNDIPAGEISFGGRIFAEYDVFKGFLVHVEGEVLNSAYLNTNGVKLHHWTIGVPIGVGYERELTTGVWLKTMVLWDPLQNINFALNSPNSNPQVRGGITYTF